ncbi:MAG TPA: hypothetical protein VLB12_02770, partial [Gemmatimonadales bacterium]|nr:hypothetical protein [Gemmatimonadales bacterium]
PPSPPPPRPIAPKQKVENQLLGLMVHSDECRKRALSSIKPEQIENEAHRELFTYLLQVDAAGTAPLSEALSEDARILLIRLLAQPPELDQKRLDVVFDGICVRLEVRPRFRELYRLERLIHSVTDSAERDALVVKRTELLRDLKKSFPHQHTQYQRWERARAAKRAQSRTTSHVSRPTSYD